jgi:hypothetical protein
MVDHRGGTQKRALWLRVVPVEAAGSRGKAAATAPEPFGAFGSGFRGLVQRTALLNAGIAVSVLALGAWAGHPANILIAFVLLPLASITLWSATFAIAAFVALWRVFQRGSQRAEAPILRRYRGSRSLHDDWLDGVG